MPIKAVAADKTITISLSNELEREKNTNLKKNVEAADGSTLVEPYKVPFEVSGGPKVKAIINVGASRVNSNAVITLDFDQPLADTQPITDVVRFGGGAATIAKVSPARVTVVLSNLPRCAPFSIDIVAGLKSNYDIATTTPWKFSSRTICYSLSTIGTSVKGRAINAYTFGTSGPITLYVGALHGKRSQLEFNSTKIG